MALIVNTLEEYPVGWTWAQHKAAGYEGGTDYEVPAGTGIRSPVAGKATYGGRMVDGNVMVDITYAVGRKISIRELNSTSGTLPRKVKIGDVIGVADADKWVHIDATILGIRRPFEPLVTPIVTVASTGSTKTLQKGLDMFLISYSKRTWLVTPTYVEEVTGHEAQWKILPTVKYTTQGSLDYVINFIKSHAA